MENEPICTIQCLCGNRIKVYMRNNRIQLSNLQKHLRVVNKKSLRFIGSDDQTIDDQENSNQFDIDSRTSLNENTRSSTQSTFNNSTQIDVDNIDRSTQSTSTVRKT